MTLHLSRLPALVAAAALFLGPAPHGLAQEEEPRPLIVSSQRVLMIRRGDVLNGREHSIQDRIQHAQQVFTAHLGGPYGRITSRKWRDRVHLYLNREFVLAVTPADAKATGYRSAEHLAPVWAAALQRAFDAGHSRPR